MVEGSRDGLGVTIEGLIQGKTGNLPPPPMPKIFKVDDRLRQVKAEDYEPKIIAIGPIHGGKEHLEKMEQQKLRYLQKLLQRCRVTERCQTCQGTERCQVTPTIDRLIGKLREMQKDARLCYPTDDLKLDGDNFIKMLLLDGCFIIELVRKYFGNGSTEENDPVLKSETLIQIRHDLMLVENQLPLSVTNQLFEMTKTNDPDDNLCLLVQNLVDDMFPWPDVLKSRLTVKSDQLAGVDHLLGLTYRYFSPFSTISRSSTSTSTSTSTRGSVEVFHLSHIDFIMNMTLVYTMDNIRLIYYMAERMPTSTSTPPQGAINSGRREDLEAELNLQDANINSTLAGRSRRARRKGGIHINSASELKKAGISLKPSNDNSLTFDGGVLKLPPFHVSGKTESILRNLMAYEQLRPDDCHRPKHVTDYVFFMHCLIRSTKDVKALRRSGVLGNYLGGDDRVYHMLDRLVTNFLRSSEFCYSSVFERLNGHCSGRREKYMARLWRDYFNSPWSLLSFIAAAVLLGISIAQLVFTVLTYKHHKKRG